MKRVKILIWISLSFYMSGNCFAYDQSNLDSTDYLPNTSLSVDSSLNLENNDNFLVTLLKTLLFNIENDNNKLWLFSYLKDNTENISESDADGGKSTIIEYENFTPTANDLYRFYISTEKEIEIKTIKLNISWTASFAGSKFIITKDKIDWPIVWTAEVGKNFTNWEVLFTSEDKLAENQTLSNLSEKNNKVLEWTKTTYFVQLDYIPSDVFIDNKGKTREINLTGIDYQSISK